MSPKNNLDCTITPTDRSLTRANSPTRAPTAAAPWHGTVGVPSPEAYFWTQHFTTDGRASSSVVELPTHSVGYAVLTWMSARIEGTTQPWLYRGVQWSGHSIKGHFLANHCMCVFLPQGAGSLTEELTNINHCIACVYSMIFFVTDHQVKPISYGRFSKTDFAIRNGLRLT